MSQKKDTNDIIASVVKGLGGRGRGKWETERQVRRLQIPKSLGWEKGPRELVPSPVILPRGT